MSPPQEAPHPFDDCVERLFRAFETARCGRPVSRDEIVGIVSTIIEAPPPPPPPPPPQPMRRGARSSTPASTPKEGQESDPK